MDQIVCGYRVHPACALLPMMGAASLREMAEDIKANGQQQPVILFQGQLLDGRNRLRACELAGVEPDVQEWRGDDPVRWVLSLNFHRRHLTDSQKSIVGARAEQLLAERAAEQASGGEPSAPHVPEIEAPEALEEEEAPDAAPPEPEGVEPSREMKRQAREAAAALVNVSTNAIARGRKLIDHAVPELVGAVARGSVSLTQASRIAKLDPERQRALADQGDAAIVEEAVRIRQTEAQARPSLTRALAELDVLCSHLTIQKVGVHGWRIEGRLHHDAEQAIEQQGETLKEAATHAWAQAQASVQALGEG